MGSGLSDLFDLTSGVGTLSGSYVAPKAVSAWIRGKREADVWAPSVAGWVGLAWASRVAWSSS